jgi:hypothetical protein
MNLIKDFILGWRKISYDKSPKWLIRAIEKWVVRFGKKHGHNPYDQRTYFKGKTFIYRVEFPTIAQGSYDILIHGKKRKK